MTDQITIPSALLEQALNALTSFEQNYGSLWYSSYEPDQIDATCSSLRAELAKPSATPAWRDAPETLALKAERDAAMKGVIRVADRKTDEFDAARAAIAKAEGESA